MGIPTKCPKCNGTSVHTETGTVVTTKFEHGVKKRESEYPLPRRTFCDDCYFEFYYDLPEVEALN